MVPWVKASSQVLAFITGGLSKEERPHSVTLYTRASKTLMQALISSLFHNNLLYFTEIDYV